MNTYSFFGYIYIFKNFSSDGKCSYHKMPYLFFNSLFFFSKGEDKSVKLFLYAWSLLTFSSYFLTLILMINILVRNITAVFLCAATPFSFGCLFSTCPHWCGALRRHSYPMSRSCWGASDLISEPDFTWGVLGTTLIFFKTDAQLHRHLDWDGFWNR